VVAVRRAVQQPGAQLLFEATDLPAQGRLGGVQGLGRAAEVPVLRHDGEAPRQPQVETGGR
jgi:hypothetical protein